MRFEERYERRQRRTLTMAEAANTLWITERTFRRWNGRDDAEGAEGLQDRRIGRASGRAVPVDDMVAMVALSQTHYTGWTVKHVHERWQQAHGGTLSYSWTKKDAPGRGAGHAGTSTRRAPQEAATSTLVRDDAPTRRLHA